MKHPVFAFFAFVIVIAMQAAMSHAQYDPHPKGVAYTENFRGQFHFSPKSETLKACPQKR